MRRQRALAVTAAGVLAPSLVFVFANSPASADPLDAMAEEARADLLGNVAPGMVEEVSETFDITASEAYDRLAVEAVASEMLGEFEVSVDGYAGLWVSEDAGEIMVATTSAAAAADIEAQGATAVLVEYDLAALEAAVDALDAVEADGVHGYYIDPASNGLVIEAADEESATDLAQAADVDPDMITADISTAEPQLFDVRGGDAYNSDNGYGCSVGFPVTQGSTKGFVTAGHCGDPGVRVVGGSAAPGTFRESVFPGADRAWVAVGSEQTMHNIVNMYNGSRYVYDSDVAAIGSSVCRSGQTTGWHCGTVQAYDQTVRYEAGTIYGMTRTNVCAEPGDSGGAFISGNSAQGMTSGGSGNCTSGGTTFFQPVNDALDDWGLTLYTGDGSEPPPSDGNAIVNRNSGKCVDVPSSSTADGTVLQQYDCWDGANQGWQLEDVGGGYYRIVSESSGKCMDIDGASTENGAGVIQWTCHGGDNQQWQARDAGGGYVELVARHSGKCLDVPSSSTANGTALQQYDCWGGANQQWSL
ncbi:RICIN domain-containing protein [Glycomyces salinus]|uniref:RICIN domain-containing protein n=1 Tax=Glycomyces salinus TaxID=980294 RepID=UPI0018ECDBB2|nr:RICIN domain-containing protein [Glycomyces salinus]